MEFQLTKNKFQINFKKQYSMIETRRSHGIPNPPMGIKDHLIYLIKNLIFIFLTLVEK